MAPLNIKIKSIEQDKKIFISSPVLPRPHDKVLRARNAPTDTTVTTVLDATWGQARISHRIPDQTDYTYETISHPAAATVYVIDTGIQTTHWEFNSTSKPGTSRARWGHNWIASSPDTDENGHGTHVSGTIAGLTYGVAPRAALVACKVFDADGGGTWSDMIDALGWACHDAAARGAVNASVVNLSAGGGFYQPINDAVSAAVGLGLAVVVAAGNDGGRVGDISPASCPDAVAVSATDEQDRRPDWASWGPGVAFFAPGVDVTSAWIGGGGQESAVLDGTSMSCPHVAGLAAYWMGMFGGHTPAQLRARLGRLATNGTVVDAGAGSANAIVYNGNKVYFDEVTDSVG